LKFHLRMENEEENIGDTGIRQMPWNLTNFLYFDDEKTYHFQIDDDKGRSDKENEYCHTVIGSVSDPFRSPRWMSYIIDPFAHRRDFLLYTPFAIQEFVNTGNLTDLSALMDRLCASICTLHTRVLTISREGKGNFVEIFASRMRSVPDYHLVVKSSIYSRRHNVLTFDGVTAGTRMFDDDSEYIYDTIHYGRKGVIHDRLRAAAILIEQSGRNYCYKADFQIRFYLNQDLFVHRIVESINVTRVCAARDDLN
jgi:hypothetical protein